jgi:hypothetical protein
MQFGIESAPGVLRISQWMSENVIESAIKNPKKIESCPPFYCTRVNVGKKDSKAYHICVTSRF